MAGKKGMHGNKLRCIHQDEIKKKIRAALIVKRLEDHILNDKEMTSSQVSAAGKLLDKIVSNAPTDINANIDATVKTHEELLSELDNKQREEDT